MYNNLQYADSDLIDYYTYQIKAEEAKVQAEEEDEYPDYDDYDMYDPHDMSTWDDEDWINFELEH